MVSRRALLAILSSLMDMDQQQNLLKAECRDGQVILGLVMKDAAVVRVEE